MSENHFKNKGLYLLINLYFIIKFIVYFILFSDIFLNTQLFLNEKEIKLLNTFDILKILVILIIYVILYNLFIKVNLYVLYLFKYYLLGKVIFNLIIFIAYPINYFIFEKSLPEKFLLFLLWVIIEYSFYIFLIFKLHRETKYQEEMQIYISDYKLINESKIDYYENQIFKTKIGKLEDKFLKKFFRKRFYHEKLI